ncbi:MAG: MBL fold metallo-hydrolase [bacterium]|jgi:glyoxylase-like metal-dependent hydrolase (beta-lactamase superfamily II)|nr:MBL fold metallo-hydrolase [Planctomycetota bacterium]HIL52100.1 MBL fold metallo-hydrolase [Planctomycetota bacterium]
MQYWQVPVTAFAQNCTLLRCEATGQGVVIDPGGDLDVVQLALGDHRIDTCKVLLTHGHLDHAGAAGELARQLAVPLEGPAIEDEFWLQALPEQAATYGLPAAEVVHPDKWFCGGDSVSFGELTLEVLHTPGHTPGHVVYFEPDSKIAVVGDVLFQGSIGRTDFPRGDFDTLIRSIMEGLMPLGDDVRVLSGHGGETTLGAERRTNPFLLDPASFRGRV